MRKGEPAESFLPFALDNDYFDEDDWVHRNIAEIFPDLDLTGIIQEFGQELSPEELVAYIIDRNAQIPKKHKSKPSHDSQFENDLPSSSNALLGNLFVENRSEFPEESIECLVCFEKCPLPHMISCTPQHGINLNVQQISETMVAQSNNDDEFSSNNVHIQKGPNQPLTHQFCRSCIRGQVTTDQQLLAEGAVGLCCMAPNCKNPILFSEVFPLLNLTNRKKLDERIIEENLAMAMLANLQRCKHCNYAIEMEVDKTVDKVFNCLKCGIQFCRICEHDWNDEHIGISCEEVARMKRINKDHKLEKRLSDAIIRKCPRCGIAFIKETGCNLMTCRCGMKMCYICRAINIDSLHFCSHQDPKCNKCNKSCLQFEDSKKRDEQMLARIHKEAAEQEKNNPKDPELNAVPKKTNVRKVLLIFSIIIPSVIICGAAAIYVYYQYNS